MFAGTRGVVGSGIGKAGIIGVEIEFVLVERPDIEKSIESLAPS